MPESFESRLIERASKEAFKKAKHILKAGELLCCHGSPDGMLRAVFRDPKGLVTRVEIKGFPNGPFSGSCACDSDTPGFCPHAVAACLHHSKYTIKPKEPDLKDGPAHYAGLKFEGLPELLTQALSGGDGSVSIEAETEFPHMPSKWERTVLSGSLSFGGRDYAGNLNNIRQLHFGKTLAASMQLSGFPQQDRQIIRYLAINAQQEGSKLSLDAEQTAEFFHCLAGFQNFKRLGEKVVVHRELAEPVLLLEKAGAGFLLRSAIIVRDAPLLLKDVKVITGRAGCWVGMMGEYWWIPASMDVAWLRGFLRNTELRCDAQSVEILLGEQAKSLPVKIIETDGIRLSRRKFRTLYDATLKDDGSLEMEILYDYEGRLCKADQLRLASFAGNFWRRDSKGENAAVEELVNFGFEMLKGASSTDGETRLRLRDREAVGAFVDEIIPSWIRDSRDFIMSSSLAALCSDANNMRMKCRVLKETSDHFDFSILLSSGSAYVKWMELVKAARHNESFISVDGVQTLVRVPLPMRRLAAAVSDIAHHPPHHTHHHHNGNSHNGHGSDLEVLRIPRLAAPYWASLALEIPGATPPEFLRLKAEMELAALPPPGNLEDIMPHTKHEFVGELRKYQREGVFWLKGLASRGYNLILADEMGLGKTIQALALLASDPTSSLPALILCPTSLIENWAREALRFVPSMKLLVISGHDRKHLWEKAMFHDIAITSYSLLKRDTEHIGRLKFKYLILDEAQHIKNPFTANSQACKSLKADHKLVLTGTPLENSPEELWSIFDFLHPGLLGTLHAFKIRYPEIHRSPDRQRELGSRIAPFVLRRKKAEVHSELPPKQEQTLCCEMDNGQRKLYETFLTEGRKFCEMIKKDPSSTSRFEMLTALLRLRQICCHPGLLPSKLITDASHSPRSAKMELLQELLMETIDSGHKVLLFSQFTSLLKIVRKWLDEAYVRYEYLDGSTKDRMQRVDSFNNSKSIPVFLLSLKAGGVGLNLTAADTVIIYDPWWNPAAEAQAADRTHRIGQTKPVTCIKLVVKNSIEERILDLQRMKSQLFENLVENPSSAMRQMTMDDLEFLLK